VKLTLRRDRNAHYMFSSAKEDM